jgi:multidrug efflux pump subunit AcrB
MMTFNLSELAVRERAVTLFLIIAIAVAGTFAFFKLGRAEDPTFTIKVLTVTTAWPGATAQEMQDLVAEPLEKRLQELRWYDRVETMTRPGLAFMTLSLKDRTPPSEVPEQFYQARKKLGDEARNLPTGALGPFVNDEYSDVTFALYALKAPGMAPRELVRQAETIRQQLLHVAGVKKVNILGERPERIFVEFSYARLATLGVGARDIFAALQRQNAVTPAGSVETKGPQVFLRLEGAYDDVQKIADTPIVASGRTLKLSDIADVRRGYEDPATFLIHHQGEPTLVLGAVMQEGWNGLDLGKALQDETDKISKTLPLGVTLSKITDQAVNISSAVDEFMLKFFVALGVVLLVSMVSLGWRVGIVVAAAVPLTLAIVFVIMLNTDRVFDRITLGAMILALGLLVDDAIIAIEMMVVKMEEGVCLEPYRGADAVRDPCDGRRLSARRLRPVERGRVRRQYLLDRRLCVDRVLGRGGRLHALSRREAVAGDQADRGRPRGDLCNIWLPPAAPCDCLVGAAKILRCRCRGVFVRARRHRHDGRDAAVLSDFGSARGPG